jgi:diguanylate cyclase (GGDEF)-like protein
MSRKKTMTGRVAKAWGRLGITSKLWLVFGVLFTMFSLSGAVASIGLLVMRGAENNIQDNMEIRAKILEMEGKLEKSRRLYRDYLLLGPELNFEAARERFCQPALAEAARLIAVSEDLRRLIAASPPGGAIARRNVDLTLFTSTARRYSQVLLNETGLYAELYKPDEGLLPRLTGVVDQLGDALQGSADAKLLLREMDVLEKRYEITRQRPFMQSALNKAAALRRLVAGDKSVAQARQADVLGLLDAYAGLADQILETVKGMQANAHDFWLQSRAVDPIAEELKQLSASEVAKARTRSVWAGRMAGGILAATALLGLACLVVAARLLHASITSKIETMTRHAEAIRAGHLDVFLQNGSSDELGVLAGAFNAMTARLKELVDTLEDKVRLRTRELAQKNRELDAKNQELATLSLTDRLTGLCNRRKLDHALEAEFRRAKRYGSVFSVIMLDLDHFKEINDAYGHATGDHVLVRTADILVSYTRETDIVGRWGGEEFLVICPETDLHRGTLLAEHLWRELGRVWGSGTFTVTASLGLAVYNGDAQPSSLLDRADAALYRAKQTGRNRVVVAPGAQEAESQGRADASGRV